VLNIVDPTSAVTRETAPFTLLGNRGHIHKGDRITKHHTTKGWIYCHTRAMVRPSDFMGEGYTELFFLDEATALAAGHRPCGRCLNARQQKFLDAWARANNGVRPTIPEIDEQLHKERFDNGRRVTYEASCADLKAGTMVRELGDPQPLLLRGEFAYPWTSHGYGVRRDAPTGVIEVLTPPSIVKLIDEEFVVGPVDLLLAW
jgi:hypothetical protein